MAVFEFETPVIVVHNLKYLSDPEFDVLSAKISELGRILNGLIASVTASKEIRP